MLVYPNDYRASLDFQQVIDLLKDFTPHERIHTLIEQLTPSNNYQNLHLILNELKELKDLFQQQPLFINHHYINLQNELLFLKKEGAVLTEDQFLTIKKASSLINEVLTFFKNHTYLKYLPKVFESCYYTIDIIKSIDQVIDIYGQVKSTASKDLSKIRKSLTEKRQESDKKFNALINRLRHQNILRDFEESIYNNRRVLAVQAEHKRVIKGNILGNSANFLTAYIEPIGNIGLNLEIDDLLEAERKEVFKILRQLTLQIRQFLPLIIAYDFSLEKLEFNKAKAKLAIEMQADLPLIENKPVIDLKNAFHPILFLHYKKLKKNVVPLHMQLNQQKRIIIISGPNAGGKSVALKTVGLLQLMLQCGLLVPASSHSTFGIFNKLLVDVGDTQSIESELSTYSSKLTRLKRFMEEANSNSLFLIDEFGTGSDPELGGALAETILEELLDAKGLGVVTTHYANIKLFAEEHEGIENGNMLFDTKSLKPKFQLSIGMPGSSYTFEVAQNVGLNKKLLQKARKKVQKSQLGFDKLLTRYAQKLENIELKENQLAQNEMLLKNVQQNNQLLQNELANRLAMEKAKSVERERLLNNGAFLEELLKNYNETKDKTKVWSKFLKKYNTEKLKELQANKTINKTTKGRKKAIKPTKLKTEVIHFKAGDSVKIKGSKAIGVIENIEKNKATVAFGFVKTNADVNRLILIKQA